MDEGIVTNSPDSPPYEPELELDSRTTSIGTKETHQTENLSSFSHIIEKPDVQIDELEYDPSELEEIRRYYPGNRTTHPFVPLCLVCNKTGHKISNCPALKCMICGTSGTHFTTGCPQVRRCTKCRQQGHAKEECPEKLIATAGGPACALCGLSGHIELDCDDLWRSFKPDPTTIQKAQSLLVFCYSCGSDRHYGADCGLHREQRFSGINTWSKANWEQYIDPQSKPRPSTAAKDLKMQRPRPAGGAGNANNPISLDDSDGENDAPFLGRQVSRAARPEPRGKRSIKFNPQAPNSTATSFNLDSRDLPSQLPSRPQGIHPQQHDDSGRYARERTFSPPPRFQDHADSYAPPLPPGPPPPPISPGLGQTPSIHGLNSTSYNSVPPPPPQQLQAQPAQQAPPGGGKRKNRKKKQKRPAEKAAVVEKPKLGNNKVKKAPNRKARGGGLGRRGK